MLARELHVGQVRVLVFGRDVPSDEHVRQPQNGVERRPDFVAHHRQEFGLVLFGGGGAFAGFFQLRHVHGVHVVMRLVVHTTRGHLEGSAVHVHLKPGDGLSLHGLGQACPQGVLRREPLPFLHVWTKRLSGRVVRQHHLALQPQPHHRIGVDLKEPGELCKALLPQASAHLLAADVRHVLKDFQVKRLEEAWHRVL